MEWKSDISTALCVSANGWVTEDEREVWRAANEFIRKVRNEAMARMLPKCEACGQRLSGETNDELRR